MMSPRFTPIRNVIRSSSGVPALRSTMLRCNATAQETASINLGNSIRMPSPVVLTMRPRCSLILGVDQFAPMRLDLRKGAFLVGAHKPPVPRDVRGENGGQPALDAFRGQSGTP
jgi:hypothetical protein